MCYVKIAKQERHHANILIFENTHRAQLKFNLAFQQKSFFEKKNKKIVFNDIVLDKSTLLLKFLQI